MQKQIATIQHTYP